MEKILASGYYGIISSPRGEKPQTTIDSLLLEQKGMSHPHIENHDYIVKRHIGEGSHSTVWLAQSNNVSRQPESVCIKRTKDGYESRLITEYNLLSIIKHPTIINPFEGLLIEGKALSMVLPYYTQSAYALKGRCDMLTVWRFCECISGALEYLNDMGLAHNDVKLSNILVDSEGRFILSDLSVAETSTHFEADDIGFGSAIMELITGETCFWTVMPPDRIIQELNAAEVHNPILRKLIIRCLSKSVGVRNNGLLGPDCHTSKTDYMQWTAINDFAIVERNNKYGLINRFHQIVIPIDNDSLTQVGLLSLPGHPGPSGRVGRERKMRCFFIKGDHCGSYLIDRDFATLELDMTQKEWEGMEQWT